MGGGCQEARTLLSLSTHPESSYGEVQQSHLFRVMIYNGNTSRTMCKDQKVLPELGKIEKKSRNIGLNFACLKKRDFRDSKFPHFS